MSQPLGFQGQYLDPTLGLYDLRARDYDPSIGAFTAKDPIAVPVGDACYSISSYGRHNPMLFHDVTGTEPRVWKDGRTVGVLGKSGRWARSTASPTSAGVGGYATAAYNIGNGLTQGLRAVAGGSGSTRTTVPSSLPSVGACTTAAECEAAACAPAGVATGFGRTIVEIATDGPAPGPVPPPRDALVPPSPPRIGEQLSPATDWNASVLRNRWLIGAGRVAPYMDIPFAGLEFNNNYNGRYADISDTQTRVQVSVERTVVTTGAAVVTTAVVGGLLAAAFCVGTAGIGCAVLVGAAAVAVGVGAEYGAGAAYDATRLLPAPKNASWGRKP